MPSIMPTGKQQFTNNAGVPLAGGKLYTYNAGTTDPKATFQDAAGTVENTNPIVLNARGEALVFWDGAYDVKVTDSNDVTIYTVSTYQAPLVPGDLSADNGTEKIGGTWFNGTKAKLSDLGTSIGSSLIGFLQAGVGAVVRTVQDKLRESVSVTDYMTDAQKADAKAYGYSIDMTLAFAAAVSYLVGRGGGVLRVPQGGYLLLGTAGLDGFKNGVLLPDTNGVFSTKNGIILQGEGVGSVLKAGSGTMVVVRASRLYSSVRDLRIDGAGMAQVHGVDLTPESITQTTELTSQSFQRLSDLHIENCTYGTLIQPGPTVAASDSGGFYYDFQRVTYNSNSGYDMWFRADATAAGNRTTRTTVSQCKFLRSVDSIRIDAGTEIDFMNCNWELWTGTMLNYVPDSAHAANIRLIGGYGESSGAAKGPVATAPEAVSLIGFAHNRAPDASEYQMNRIIPGAWNIAKVPGLPSRLSFGYAGFVDFVADPDNTGQRVAEIQTNGVRRERYAADGSKIFYGTLGNVTMSGTGTGMAFSYNGSNTIDALGGASATLSFRTNQHIWANAAGAMIATMTGTEFIPRVSNATANGNAGFLWSSVWAANGSIQTSDPRTKKDIQPTPLGMGFVRLLRPVAFRFIVGGNKVVGAKVIKEAELDNEGREIVPAVVEPIVESTPGKRLHHGFLTTEVKAALDQLGGVDFGGYVKTDPDDPDSPEALRYDQFIAPLTLGLQETDRALTAALERIAALEARLTV